MQTCHHSLAFNGCQRTAYMIAKVRCFRRFGHAGPSKSSDAGAITGRRQAAAAAADTARDERRYAVIGAGLAGLATAYYLQRLSPAGTAVLVDVYDSVGIGAGGSGAAAGLLHPFTPRGKLLWKAPEAMSAALELLEAAETAAAAAEHEPADPAAAAAATGLCGPISWRTGMIRHAANTKQSQDYWKVNSGNGSSDLQQQQQQGGASVAAAVQQLLQATVVDSSTAQHLVPGLVLIDHDAAAAQQNELHMDLTQQQQQQPLPRQPRQQRHQQQRKLEGWSPTAAAALHVPGGITLHPQRYMHALWAAAELATAARGDGSSISLHIRQLRSLQDLYLTQGLASSSIQNNKHLGQSTTNSNTSGSSSSSGSGGRGYDAVVVAAGAAIGCLKEFAKQHLPLTLCQGYTLDMTPPEASEIKLPPYTNSTTTCSASNTRSSSSSGQSAMHFGPKSPSILGSPYLASQGGDVLVVGATKEYAWTDQQAFNELGRKIDSTKVLGSFLESTEQQQMIKHNNNSKNKKEKQEEGIQTSEGPGVQITGKQILQHHHHQQQQQQQCGDKHNELSNESEDVSAAAAELLAGAAAVWPAVLDWQLRGVRSGVRAMPPRTQYGSVPLLGRWTSKQQQQQQQQQEEEEEDPDQEHNLVDDTVRPPVWLIVGLGARGLVYHAWLGKLTAQSVITDSEECISSQAPELLAWQDVGGM